MLHITLPEPKSRLSHNDLRAAEVGPELCNLARLDLARALADYRSVYIGSEHLFIEHANSWTIKPGQIVDRLSIFELGDERDEVLGNMALSRISYRFDRWGRLERTDVSAPTGIRVLAQAAWYISMMSDENTARNARESVLLGLQERAMSQDGSQAERAIADWCLWYAYTVSNDELPNNWPMPEHVRAIDTKPLLYEVTRLTMQSENPNSQYSVS